MQANLTKEQSDLAEYMSELSEEAYYAGWMHGLEHALWNAIEEGPRSYGHLDLTTYHIVRLRELSAACGGWIYFDEESDRTWVPLSQWIKTLYRREEGRRF